MPAAGIEIALTKVTKHVFVSRKLADDSYSTTLLDAGDGQILGKDCVSQSRPSPADGEHFWAGRTEFNALTCTSHGSANWPVVAARRNYRIERREGSGSAVVAQKFGEARLDGTVIGTEDLGIVLEKGGQTGDHNVCWIRIQEGFPIGCVTVRGAITSAMADTVNRRLLLATVAGAYLVAINQSTRVIRSWADATDGLAIGGGRVAIATAHGTKWFAAEDGAQLAGPELALPLLVFPNSYVETRGSLQLFAF